MHQGVAFTHESLDQRSCTKQRSRDLRHVQTLPAGQAISEASLPNPAQLLQLQASHPHVDIESVCNRPVGCRVCVSGLHRCIIPGSGTDVGEPAGQKRGFWSEQQQQQQQNPDDSGKRMPGGRPRPCSSAPDRGVKAGLLRQRRRFCCTYDVSRTGASSESDIASFRELVEVVSSGQHTRSAEGSRMGASAAAVIIRSC
jgi:hypothetical protein